MPFLAAYRSFAKLHDPSKIASWLRTITRYTYHHWQRKQPKTEALQDDSMDTIRTPESSQPDRIENQSSCPFAHAGLSNPMVMVGI